MTSSRLPQLRRRESAVASRAAGRASPRAARPPPRPAAACACGGSCPLCESLEHDANRVAAAALQRGAWSPAALARAVGLDPASIAIHADAPAAASARVLNAAAFTVGSDIHFGAGRYAPREPAGAALLAHEMAHVAQQRRAGVTMLQRQAADVTFPDAPISDALRPVTSGVRGLGALTTPRPVDEIGSERVDEQAPDSTQRLPFTGGGAWEAGEILTRLGQFDDLPGTDSDADRCVQAVAMASHIVEGPAAVRQYLNAVLLEAALSRPQGTRENKARDVLAYFIARLDNELATYGDVSWAQEALHDLFYADREGTPEGDVEGLLAETGGPERSVQTLDIWCESPAEVVAQARQLLPGQQLLIVPVTVTFNQALDEAAPDPTSPPVDELDVTLDTGRRAHVTRFDTSGERPPATAIDAARDKVSGHQMLVMRDASTGELRVYEPERVDSGDHFMELDPEGRNFERDFRDLPALQVFGYVHVIGRITPKTAPPRMFTQYRPSWL